MKTEKKKTMHDNNGVYTENSLSNQMVIGLDLDLYPPTSTTTTKNINFDQGGQVSHLPGIQ